MMPGMTRYALLFPLLILLMSTISSCRHHRVPQLQHGEHEEATPVSELGEHDFHKVTPQHRKKRR